MIRKNCQGEILMAQEMTLEEKKIFGESCSQKYILGKKRDKIKHEIDSIEHELKLVKIYKKYQQLYKKYKETLESKTFGRKKYESENEKWVEKYRKARSGLIELHPDKKIPVRETLEKKIFKLNDEYNEICKQYLSNEVVFNNLVKKGYSESNKRKTLNDTCPELELTLF